LEALRIGDGVLPLGAEVSPQQATERSAEFQRGYLAGSWYEGRQALQRERGLRAELDEARAELDETRAGLKRKCQTEYERGYRDGEQDNR